jgi:hypothetical protein
MNKAMNVFALAIWPVFSGCDTGEEETDSDLSELREHVGQLQEELAILEEKLASLEEAEDPDGSAEPSTEPSGEPSGEPSSYSDEDAVAAVQNSDPWSSPDEANLLNLWSQTDYGYQWLDSSRWTMDNRSMQPGSQPRHELVQMFHETPECALDATSEECNSAGAMKIFLNGPRITDNDWSDDGYAASAAKRYHTHASGIYIASFGQLSRLSDLGGLIPPSGIHLEPHGSHQGLRIDGSVNSGENIRIDTSLGSKGIAIYGSDSPSPYCDSVDGDCEVSHPLYLRGGTLHFEDLRMERSADDARNGGASWLHSASMGVEPFYSWHEDAQSGLPVHCTWSSAVGTESLIRLQAYSASPDLPESHSYSVVEVWGPGEAPAACAASQSIKTDAAGVYGYSFPSSMLSEGGFSVAIHGPGAAPLYPGDWAENDRPSFLFEVVDPL